MVWRPSGSPAGPLRDHCEAPLAFKSDGFAWEVSHFLKTQATTENEDEQLSELPISILPRKTRGLADIRPFGRPLQDPREGSLAFKSGGFAWEVLHSLKIQATTENDEEQVNELTIGSSPRKTHGLAAIRPSGRPPPRALVRSPWHSKVAVSCGRCCGRCCFF